jgi:uncharacterized membrane protein YkvA (DUF1232 family)
VISIVSDNMKIRDIVKPYIAQYKRSPLWVKVVSSLIVLYLATPLDLWDILFPWMALADDVFLAGVLLKMLHKYGSLPEEDKTTPTDIINQIKASRKARKGSKS